VITLAAFKILFEKIGIEIVNTSGFYENLKQIFLSQELLEKNKKP
jgi:hypothetical protein